MYIADDDCSELTFNGHDNLFTQVVVVENSEEEAEEKEQVNELDEELD